MASTSDDDLRALLAQVASGTVAPDEASARLSDRRPADPADETGASAAAPAEAPSSGVRVLPPTPPHPPQPPPPPAAPRGSTASGPVERVVVRAQAVKLVLLGDPTVAGAAVEGPHVARRDGGALVIDTEAKPSPGGFSYESDRPKSGWSLGRWRGGETVVVRLRPDLPVDVTVQAGSIVATRLEGGLRFVVEAGSLKASDCQGPLDGRVEAGSAKLDWLLDRGSSKLRCELGSIQMRLDPRSDVTVLAKAELGSVELGPGATATGDGRRSLVVGAGHASLDVAVELGSVKVGVAQ